MKESLIKIGQVWESQDPRDGHRRLTVVGFEEPGDKVIVISHSGRTTRIKGSRLRPQGKRGYVLVYDGKP